MGIDLDDETCGEGKNEKKPVCLKFSFDSKWSSESKEMCGISCDSMRKAEAGNPQHTTCGDGDCPGDVKVEGDEDPIKKWTCQECRASDCTDGAAAWVTKASAASGLAPTLLSAA